ncbi:hypothetical protein M011DRAFT_475549 [Sporormia fimetaria CBS 119925]|uniref:Uncharacterized protein n=1 Tax=Sporormia fimetaria CBS 119925 TaxID=1340428 RepID=A0A6A6VFX1_9PLEO|nr:hypothetical protein M011DRAFT_475549 [Sporormia fimetaria CBS 119925]
MSADPAPDSTRFALSTLTQEHLATLDQALSNILSTDLAYETYAQIVDGLPTRDVYEDYYVSRGRRVDYDNNLRPSQQAMDIVKAQRESLDIKELYIDAETIEAYQKAEKCSSEFTRRMMEIVAILCHDIAVYLYTKYEGGIRKPSSPPPQPEPVVLPGFEDIKFAPIPPLPAEFFHHSYLDWEQYPNGVADIVGYWAEYRLFGGVMLFDRGESGTECKNVYIHPIGPVGGYFIFELTEAQVQQFVDSALSEQKPDPSLKLRFKCQKWPRIDPYDAMSLNVYRDKYERKISDQRPQRCVRRVEDMEDPEEYRKRMDSRTWNRRD